jgi:hypothetical protein
MCELPNPGQGRGQSQIAVGARVALAYQLVSWLEGISGIANGAIWGTEGDINGKPARSINPPTQESIPAHGGYCSRFRPLRGDEELRLRENRRKLPMPVTI